MKEISMTYEEFTTIAMPILNGDKDLRVFATSETFQNLFTHPVNHPVGYVDGGSQVPIGDHLAAYQKISEADRPKLTEIAELLLRRYRKRQNISRHEKLQLLRSANQLAQHPKLHERRWLPRSTPFSARRSQPVGNGIKADDLVAKVAKEYHKSSLQIPEWDAHIADNKSFWHIYQCNPVFDIGSALLTTAGLHYAGFPAASETHLLLLGSASFLHVIGDIGTRVLFQEKGRSFSRKTDLVTDSIYSKIRHPLYSVNAIHSVAMAILGANPFSLFYGAQRAFHNFRACEEQDIRLQILHGDDAVTYQNDVNATVPGTNTITTFIARYSPHLARIMETPVTSLLRKIPGIGTEPSPTDFLIPRIPEQYV